MAAPLITGPAISTTVAGSTPATMPVNNATPAPIDANFGYKAPLAPGQSAFGPISTLPPPAVAAPHPASTPVAPSPTGAPGATSVQMPDGSTVKINSKGEVVSGNLPQSAAADAYMASQKHTADAANASKLGTQTNATGTAPFVSTSDSVQNWEKGIQTTLSQLTGDNAAQTQAHNDYLTQLQTESDALNARRDAEVANINATFASEKKNEQDTQNNETGALTVTTQRAGGYLGAGASQTGALISLNNQHLLQMQSLEAKRQSAIQTAQTAIDDKQFTLAEAKAKEAKDYGTAQHDATQKYFEDQIQIHDTSQKEITFQEDQAKLQLTGLASLTEADLANVDPATLKNIDQAYGVPGFAKNYIATTHAAAVAKSSDDALVAQQKLLTLLQDIPQGKKVTFPDPSSPNGPGTTYTGMGKVSDLQTFMETDNNGNNTLITYNKATNTITRKGAGGGGHVTKEPVDPVAKKAVSLNHIGEFINDPLNKVLVPGDPTNANSPKYMTADNYAAMYQKFVKAYPGQGSDFVSQYPVELSVLPSQRKATALDASRQSDSTRKSTK